MFEETECEEDQARMVMDGSVYFDLEANDGQWIRVLWQVGFIRRIEREGKDLLIFG